MALGYIALALIIVAINITELPAVIKLIVSHAFGWQQALGGGVGIALMHRTRHTSRKAGADTDLGRFHRYINYMYLHRVHYTFQWCAAGRLYQRGTTYATSIDE